MASSMVNAGRSMYIISRTIQPKLLNSHSLAHSRFFSDSTKHVGFIGLGNMGSHMATNLMNKGYNLSVHDLSKEAVSSIAGKGGKVCDSAAAVATAGADCIVTMLPNNKIVLDVYCGQNGLISKAKKGSLLIDSSTVDPSVAIEIDAQAKSKGVVFVDAPVSGGVNAAKAATLTFMVGGEAKHFERASPYLQCMGGNIMHCGAVGMGLTAKICNNMLLAITMIGTSECMNLGMRLGLDPKVLLNIVNTSSGRCWSSEVYCPVPGLQGNVPSSNQYKGGFATKLMTKDLGLAIGIATESQSPIPLGALCRQLYSTMLTKGYADKDFSVIYEFLSEKS